MALKDLSFVCHVRPVSDRRRQRRRRRRKKKKKKKKKKEERGKKKTLSKIFLSRRRFPKREQPIVSKSGVKTDSRRFAMHATCYSALPTAAHALVGSQLAFTVDNITCFWQPLGSD